MDRKALARKGLSLAAACALAASATAGTIVVDPGGGGDYTQIQDAIDNALPGDTIMVLAGTYIEDLIVDQQVSIVGAGIGSTILLPATSIPGMGAGSQIDTTTWMIKVRASGVTIADMTIDGNNPVVPAPIDARGGVVTDFGFGTFSGLTVMGCEVRNMVYRGIYVGAGGTGHVIAQNQVSNVAGVSLDSAGILFFAAVGDATGNVVGGCSIGIGYQGGGGGTVSGNEVDSAQIAILTNGSTSPVLVQGNTITASEQGVQSVAASTAVDVVSNDVQATVAGLSFYGLGAGTNDADGNVLDGLGTPGSRGVFVTTEVPPFGFGAVTVTLTNNVIRDNERGVELAEDVAMQVPVLSCTLSSDAGSYNVFSGNTAFNVYLADCNDPVDATHNAWGAVTPALIEPTVFHQVDDPALGLVDFSSPVGLVVTVDDDGPADFASINPAVQAVLAGGTVEVAAGTYVEDVLVDRPCVVQGAGPATLVQPASVDPNLIVVTVTGSDVTLAGLAVDGTQPVHGRARRAIFGAGISGLTVVDCQLSNSHYGISYVGSTGGRFLRNTIADFGNTPFDGAGINVQASDADVGEPGNGNLVSGGSSPGCVFAGGATGTCAGNRFEGLPLGFLASNSGAVTFQTNQARSCAQGYQSNASGGAVAFLGNTAIACTTGISLFATGPGVQTLTGNYSRHAGGSPASVGVFATTDSAFGDDEVHLVASGNSLTGAAFGVVLSELGASQSLVLDADLDGGAAANWFVDNTVQEIALQQCNDSVDATGNYFGTTNLATLEGRIFHAADQAQLGVVDFTSPRPPGPDLRAHGEFSGGSSYALLFSGQQGQLSFPFYSFNPASIPTAFGTLLVSPPLFELEIVTFSPGGFAFRESQLNPLTSGFTVYLQALTGNMMGAAFTNAVVATAP